MSRREFHSSGHPSNKFWAISLSGNSYTVTYGRIGTSVQTRTKEFTTSAETHKAFEAIIQTKLREGYVEITSVNNTQPNSASSIPPLLPTEPAPVPIYCVSEDPPPGAKESESALAISRTLNLSPDDWRWANWRNSPPLERTAPRPFEKEEAIKLLKKVKVIEYGLKWNWADLPLPQTMTRQEAHFWFVALTSVRYQGWKNKMVPSQLADKLESENFDGQLSLPEALKAITDAGQMATAEIMLPLSNLFNLTELLDLFIGLVVDWKQNSSGYISIKSQINDLVSGFQNYLLPYLKEGELEIARQKLRPYISRAIWPSCAYDVPFEFLLAAKLGMSAEMKSLVEAWDDNTFVVQNGWVPDYYHRPQEIIFGLDDPKLVEYHIRRLKLRLHKSKYIRAWLSHTGYSKLDLIRDSIQGETNAQRAGVLLNTFALVVAPEAAPYMLELKLNSKAASAASRWLEEHPAVALAGLIPIATGRGKLAEAALDFILVARRKGYEELIQAQLEQLEPEAAKSLGAAILNKAQYKTSEYNASNTPEWLKIAPSGGGGRNKLPHWATPANLPPVVVGEKHLNEAQIYGLLAALKGTGLDKKDPFIEALKAHKAETDQFGWALFQTWLGEGAPSKEKWALAAVGHLGGDPSALKLIPLIRAWPGESQHQRAVLGLECLRVIGTDTALMQINFIAEKVQFKGLKGRALQCMEEIAQARGLSRVQLEDRVVPDCGLNERGSAVLDFGPRKFYLALSPDLTPMVRDEAGKLKNDLPKPTGSDDPVKASAAITSWKLLKKQVKEVAKIQSSRLEQTMITGRRWTLAEFEPLFVHHPLMTHLSRLLVWGCYDQAGGLTATFRVTEDLEYADQNDDGFSLDGLAQVGIVHPAHLSPEDNAAWSQLFADYQLIPPFIQIGRSVYGLEGDEPDHNEITRYKDKKVPAIAMVGMLDKMGWARGIPQDSGVFYEHTKPFYGANVTAVVEYQGIPIGYMEGWDEQSIERCFFVPGIYTPAIMYPQHKNAMLLLKEVDRVVISEVLRSLHTIASKGN